MKRDKDPLAELVSGLSSAGRTESSSSGFTLASDKARAKLQEFALSNPENFQLLLLAGLYALGSRHFQVEVDADDLRVAGDLPLDRGAFHDLWKSVVGGSGGLGVLGYRVLAIAILTSVRFDSVDWRIESRDQEGSWMYQVEIRRGDIHKQALQSMPSAPQGVAIHVKRKSLGQVVSRFFQRTFRKFIDPESDDIRLFRDRVFLPRESTLTINGQALLVTSNDHQISVLASLKSGDAPDLVDCPRTFRRKKDHTMLVLMVDPDRESDSSVPGLPKTVHWIWNGLRMDTTALGLSYDFCRVFVWAPELRTDLSFSSLIDNREKQSMERTARDLVRELLKDVALSLKEDLERVGPSRIDEFAAARKIILTAIGRRIDMSANRNRFASVNRSLVECPIFRVSKEDGSESLESFADLWSLYETGAPLALFRDRKEWRPVNPWRGRPLVVYTDGEERNLLLKKFGRANKLCAATLLEELAELTARKLGEGLRLEQSLPTSQSNPLLQGRVTVGAESVDWKLNEVDEKALKAKNFVTTGANLKVLREGRLYFEDATLPLPACLSLQTEAAWEPDYLGRMADRDLLLQVLTDVVLSMLDAVAAGAGGGPPGLQDALLSAMLLVTIDGYDDKLFQAAVVRKSAWMVARRPSDGPRWWSPQDFEAHLARWDAPVYYGRLDLDLDSAKGVGAWKELEVLAIPSSVAELAGRVLGRKAESARGFDRLARRVLAPDSTPMGIWTSTIEGARCQVIHGALKAIKVTVLSQTAAASDPGLVRLQHFLHQRPLALRTVSGAISPVHLDIWWEDAWPDGSGKSLYGGVLEGLESHLTGLLREVALEFFENACARQIYEADSTFVACGLFEILSEPELRHRKVLLLADGHKVGVKDLPTPEGSVDYFTRPTLFRQVPGHTVYAPGALPELLPLLCETPWWVNLDDTTELQAPLGAAGIESPTFGTPESLPAEADEGALVESSEKLVTSTKIPFVVKARKPQQAKPVKITPEPSIPEAVPDLEVVEVSSKDRTPLSTRRFLDFGCSEEAQPLLTAFLELEDVHSVPHAPRFLEFLSALEFAAEPSPTLEVRSDGRVFLGRNCRTALSEDKGRWMLLSALYSAFNRWQTDVTDLDEKVFHTRLLRRSLQGLQGSAGSD